MRAVNVCAQVQYIDFEGRSDGESIQKIVSQLKPRRLILVRGSPESTLALQGHAKQWTDARIFTPSKGEVIDATTETHIYQVIIVAGYSTFSCIFSYPPPDLCLFFFSSIH